MGLLAPGRDTGGQRRYGEADLVRVAVILMGKEAGFGLGELRELLAKDNPMDHPQLLQRHLSALEDASPEQRPPKNSSSMPCRVRCRSISVRTHGSRSRPASHRDDS